MTFMTQTFKLIIGLIVIMALIFLGYNFGLRTGRDAVRTELIENYSFVRHIAELASLEVDGVTTLSSTNLINDGSISDRLKKIFAEQTVHLAVPYAAKFGVDLKDSTLQILRKDSLIEIHLPPAKLLSFELRVDRMDLSNRAGLLSATGPDLYTDFQKQLYLESRAQLAQNNSYLLQTEQGIRNLMQEYFRAIGFSVRCVFGKRMQLTGPKND